MDFIDNKDIINNVHFSETQYKLVTIGTVLDEIYRYLLNSNGDQDYFGKFKHLIETQEYDSECIQYDVPSGNIFNCIKNKKIIHGIKQIINKSIISNKYKDVYFRYNESVNVFQDSYEIYMKNQKLFGNEYILLQTIDKTHFKNCTTEFIDNLFIDSFDNM
eukprot:133395_1